MRLRPHEDCVLVNFPDVDIQARIKVNEFKKKKKKIDLKEFGGSVLFNIDQPKKVFKNVIFSN